MTYPSELQSAREVLRSKMNCEHIFNRKCWRRKSTRAPHLFATEYGVNFRVAIENLFEMTKNSLPPGKVAGCVLLKDVFTDRMEGRYADPKYTNLLRRPTDLELKLTKSFLLVKTGTCPTLVLHLIERNIMELYN